MTRKLGLLATLLLALSLNAKAQSITSVAPSFGGTGAIVSIRGFGLAPSGEVWARQVATEEPPGMVVFNGTPAEVVFWSEDLISVRVPPGASTGPIRIVIGGRALNGGDFEVYYSKNRPLREMPEVGVDDQRFDRPFARDEEESRPRFLDQPPANEPTYFAAPWFSNLSPGNRTFLGEHPNEAFWLGNPFLLGPNGFRDGGFHSGFGFNSRFGFGRFNTFGFGRPFFFDFSNHGRGHAGRPFSWR